MMTSAMLPRQRPIDTSNVWASLQEKSDISAAQELIRDAIRVGAIRVVPGDDGRIRIIGGKAPTKVGKRP